MENNKYVIDLCGSLTEVSLSFFEKKEINKHDIIGDIHFIQWKGILELVFSIHNNTWVKVQQDLRDKKIDTIFQ